MDDVDCCAHSLSKSQDAAGCILLADGGDQGNDMGKLHTENLLSGTPQKGQWLASPYQLAGEYLGHQRPRESAANENVLMVPLSIDNGQDGGLSSKSMATSQKGESGIFRLKSFQSQEPEEGQSEKHETGHYSIKNGSQTDNEMHLNHDACDTVSPTDHMTYLPGVSNRDNAPLRGTDETDQGQVVPTFNLTENHSEYSPELSSRQYYPKPEDGLSRSTNLITSATTTVKESTGSSSGRLEAAISDACMTLRREGPPTTGTPCAISESGITTVQGQMQANSKLPLESGRCMESEELTKRKMCMEEREGEDQCTLMKKQKVSPTVQSDVQYNQNVLSMPREYKVGGTGNYIFDSPNNCTFHLYRNHSDKLPHKQHAYEWAGLSTQTDGISDTMPVRAIETVAKLIAPATNWKTFARRLPMSECCNLEANIRTLEECQGTTSDKTLAVLIRWWKDHPQQTDGVAMKTRLREGLEACGLIRLARTLDKYL